MTLTGVFRLTSLHRYLVAPVVFLRDLSSAPLSFPYTQLHLGIYEVRALPDFKTVLLWAVCRTEFASYNLKNCNLWPQLLVDQGFVGLRYPQRLPRQSPSNRQQMSKTANVFCFLHKDFSHSTSPKANNILRNRLWGRLSPELAQFSAENWLKIRLQWCLMWNRDNLNYSLWQQSCHWRMQTLLAWSESHLNNEKNSCTQSRLLLNFHQVCCGVATLPYGADIQSEVHRVSCN